MDTEDAKRNYRKLFNLKQIEASYGSIGASEDMKDSVNSGVVVTSQCLILDSLDTKFAYRNR